MAKSKTTQQYVFKIRSEDIIESGMSFNLSLDEARKNSELLVSMSDSQLCTWLNELSGTEDSDDRAKEIRDKIKIIKKQPNSVDNRKEIKKLYKELYEVRLLQNFVMVVIKNKSDYLKLLKGFKINGVKYKRLLGSPGSIKHSTIFFVSENLYPEIIKRINNGRNENVLFNPSKLEAYMSLTTSGSIPVSMPKFIVVRDCSVKIKANVISLDDSSDDPEPEMQIVYDKELEVNASDGYGLMMPYLSERWNSELYDGMEGTISCVNTRYSFTKGVLVTFNFVDFCEKVAGGNYFIEDYWNTLRDVREYDCILTESMVKLAEAYNSYEEFIANCQENKYQFRIAKTSPHELENERKCQYQYLQGYDLTDNDIAELVAPTVNDIKDILGLDWKKSILYLAGVGLNEKNVMKCPPEVRALMLAPDMIEDPFLRSKIRHMITKKIRLSKIGSLQCRGNYAIACGDPFGLAQSIWKLPITGLLKANECYHKYWIDRGIDKIAVFRSPQTSHNNTCCLSVVNTEEMDYWYKYITCCIILNSWDCSCMKMNGQDFDVDANYTTDNSVLVRKWRNLMPIECVQRKAKKYKATEIEAAMLEAKGFGDEIGSCTNIVTSILCHQSNFPVGSKEFDILGYRVLTGQLYSQNSIDKLKGIECKSMPKNWYIRRENSVQEGDNDEVIAKKILYQTLCANTKPYFMRYRYNESNKKYRNYITKNSDNAIRKFRKTLDELLSQVELSESEQIFVDNYWKYMPLSCAPSTVNRICWYLEKQFDNLDMFPDGNFDKNLLKSDVEYSMSAYNAVKRAYRKYCNKLDLLYRTDYNTENVDTDDSCGNKLVASQIFKEECVKCCPNEDELSNILIDLLYSSNKSKQLVWDLCGEVLFNNLVRVYGNILHVPMKSVDGDFEYKGDKFALMDVKVGGNYAEDNV